MGTFTAPRRDYRFMTAAEKEFDRVFALAMSAMTDVKSDESQMLGESVTDDMSDVLELLCGVTEDNFADYGYRLLLLSRKHKEQIAESEAQLACESIPGDDR